MNSIYLVRHGEYDNPLNILPGRLPVELSETGKSQIKKLAEYFKDKNIKKIYSSAVLRCKQTSEIISAGKIQIEYDKRLLETFSAYQGYWEENKYQDGYHFYSHRNELGGESLKDIQARMGSFWNEVTKELTENIIICSHGDPLAVLYSHIHKIPLFVENTPEEKIPGWIKRGDFLEVKIEGEKII